MERFLGNIDAKVDTKGRVFVPALFRKTMQSSGVTKLVMRKDIFQDCLVLYPESVWNETVDELRAKLNKWNKEEQETFRFFILNAEEMELDSSGRILISKKYLQKVGISSEVRFVGMDNTIEIWAKEKLEKPLMSTEDFELRIEKFMQ